MIVFKESLDTVRTKGKIRFTKVPGPLFYNETLRVNTF